MQIPRPVDLSKIFDLLDIESGLNQVAILLFFNYNYISFLFL